MGEGNSVWITKKAHWLIGKFLKGGFNHVVAFPSPTLGQTSWYVNGQLVGNLSNKEEKKEYPYVADMDSFPFAMPADWIKELHEPELLVETLMYSEYYRPLIRESAIYDNGVLACPKCGKNQADIPHGEGRKCQCGLTMERWGNALQISL